LKSPIYPHLVLFTVALVFGANFVIAKNVLDPGHIFPFGFILLRVLFGVIFFWLVFSIFFTEKVEKRDLPLLAVCGFFGIAVNQMFFFKGLKLTSAMNASLIIMIAPLLVVLFSAVIIREKITFKKILGILLGGIGAAMILLSNKNLNSGDSGFLGDMFIVLNATSFAIYLVLVKSLMKKYSAFTVIKWAFSFGLLFILPFGFGELKAVEWSAMSNTVLWSIAYVLVLATIYAYTMNIYALKFVSPASASAYIYVQPFVASSISIMLGRDEISVIKVLAAILIFTGVYFVSFTKATNKDSG
jgi:drug/metabolite transporter (DMT)-like permease